MSALFVIRTFIELSLILLLVYGFYKEDKVIAFEKNVKKIIRYYVRNYKLNKARKRSSLTLHKGGKHSGDTIRVA